MNFKTTLVLILLAVVVVAYFVFVERGTVSPREQARQTQGQDQAEGTALFADVALDPEAVTHVRIEREDETVVLERDGEDWRQAEPVRFPLQAGSIRQLVRAAAELRYLDRFEAGAGDMPTHEDAGLEPARATITLTHGETSTVLRLGERSLGNHGYVALADDARIHVVNDALHDQLLDNTVNDWRRRTLDGPEATATDRVVLDRRGDASFELTRADGQWYLDAERTQRADEDAVKRVVNAVKDARIEAFVADNPETLSRFGLNEPRVTCILHTPAIDEGDDSGDDTSESGRVHTLRIGQATDLSEEQFFATWSVDEDRSPVVFTLRQSTIEPLEIEADDLRDPGLVVTESREIKAVEIERPDRPALHLVRDVDEGFIFGDPNPGHAVDYDAATSLLDALADAEATGYRPDFSAENEPVATVRITERGSEATETLRLFAGDEEETYLSVREDEPVAYRVSADTLADLFKPRLAFRNRDVLDLDGDAIAQVTLVRDDGETFRFRRAAQDEGDATWTLADEEAFEADAFEALRKSLAPLRVERWIVDEAVEPGQGWIALTVRMQDGGEHVLRVDAETRRAVLNGMDAGFVLPGSVVDRLAAEYRQRTVLNLERAAIETVTIDEALTIYRDADDRYVSQAGAEVDQSRAGRLFDALVRLKVERYVSADRDTLPAATRRIIVQMRDDTTHELEIHTGDDAPDPRLATVDGRPIRLRSSDHDALTAALTDDEAETDGDDAAEAVDAYK
ncbi:MAG: DUF4340 domain-containing protein [Phycisphaeraceae bacterium]